jgi:hypothetical protein
MKYIGELEHFDKIEKIKLWTIKPHPDLKSFQIQKDAIESLSEIDDK